MTAEEILKAMETYGLTLRRLEERDSFGHERSEGWLAKHTGVYMYGRTPSEAVEKVVKDIKEKHAESLYRDFLDKYSYIVVGIDVVKSFVKMGVKTRDRENELDLLRDYVLSQNLEEDVVE